MKLYGKMKRISFGLLAVTSVSLYTSFANAGQVQCSAQDLTPYNSQFGRCFSLSIYLTLDIENLKYELSQDYERKQCGGWPPGGFYSSGSLKPDTNGSHTLDGEGQAEQVVVANGVATFTLAGVNYGLHCE